MYKRLISMLLVVLMVVSLGITGAFSAFAVDDNMTTVATFDESTPDESTDDEVKIVISEETNIPHYNIKGTVVGYIGDVDVNDKVNIKDATAIQKYMAKIIYFSEQSKALADVDLSGNVNIKDATAIQKYLASFDVNCKVMCTMYETGAHNHNYVKFIVEPKCTEGGYTSYSCICGEEYHEDETPATSHNYESKVIKPTCSKDGYTVHTCKKCNHSYQDTKVAKTGKHNFSGGVCKDCDVNQAEFSFDVLSGYIKDRGDYASEENAYYYPLHYLYEGDEAYLVYAVDDNAVCLVYLLNESGYQDILSLAIVRGEKDFGFMVLCQDAFESLVAMEMSKFSKDTEKVADMEIYHLSDWDDAEATHYTLGFIKGALDSYTVNYTENLLPVSLKELGFTKF